MSERSEIVGATLAGAAIGAVVGYLFFSSAGRRLRGEIEPRIMEVSRDILRVRDAVTKAVAAVNEGRRSFERLGAAEDRWPVYDTPTERDVPFV